MSSSEDMKHLPLAWRGCQHVRRIDLGAEAAADLLAALEAVAAAIEAALTASAGPRRLRRRCVATRSGTPAAISERLEFWEVALVPSPSRT